MHVLTDTLKEAKHIKALVCEKLFTPALFID